MIRDIKTWTQACQHCQAAKITKHNSTAPIIMAPSSGKFHNIHLDVVGPLNELKGMRYILTAVNRFSCWTMAEPMPDQLASTVADTFIRDRYSTTAFLTQSPETEEPTSNPHCSITYSALPPTQLNDRALAQAPEGRLASSCGRFLLGRLPAPHHAQSPRRTA